jgi:hypothetical protein
MRKIHLYLVVFLVIAAVSLLSTGARARTWDSLLSKVPEKWRDGVARNLDLAASQMNDAELVTALNTYPAGTSKFKAVCFLIANLDKNAYVEYVNPKDPLNPFSPENEDIDWVREYVYDYASMTSALLIEDVEVAFKAREKFPWCKNLPEDVFFKYVLPYRSTQEPLVSWRPEMLSDLTPLVKGLHTSSEVAEKINICNRDRFHFDPLYYRHPEDRDIPTCLDAGAGRCEDMSNLSNYSLRALGVPTTSDFTPWWPKGDNNHAWNTVYDNGKWHSFMGCEPSENPVFNGIKASTFAKVYRNCYSADPIMGPAPDGTKPPRLMRSPAVDVTREYSSVSDIELNVENPARATYLCVFNYGTWQAVAGAWAEDDRVSFPDVGNHDILYCATQYVEDSTGWGDHLPVASPFVLHLNGKIDFVEIEPRNETRGEMVLPGWNPTTPLATGEQVSLFNYSGRSWSLMGNVSVTEDKGAFIAAFQNSAYQNGLFILSDTDDPEKLKEGSRPFVWIDGEVTYY